MPPLILHSQTTSLHKETNILYTGIMIEDLGVHIGVYQPCPDLKRSLVAMSERTGMTVSQVTDEVLYKGLIGMQEMDELAECGGGDGAQHTDPPGGSLVPPHKILKVVGRISAYMFHQIVPPVRHPPQSFIILVKQTD